MLGEPALFPAHDRGNAQRKTLLAEQCVAAVAGAERPYFLGFRIVNDVLVLLAAARPRHILLSRRERRADRMHAGNEIAIPPRISHTVFVMRVMRRMLTTT